MSDSLISVASGRLRDRHYVLNPNTSLYERTTLIEGQRTNLVPNNVTLSGWASGNTPTVTGGQADPFGGTDGWLIEDNDAGNNEYKSQTVTFTGDAVKAISVCMKQGTAAASTILLFDNTASVARLAATATWVDGAPGTPAMSAGTYLGQLWLGGGWYWLLFQSSAVVAANTNQFRLHGATNTTTSTGSTYYAFPQAENAPVPSSIIRTTGSTASRSADVPYLPFTAPPQAMTAYVRFFEMGTVLAASGDRILQIGLTSPATDPRFFIADTGGGFYRVGHDNGTAEAFSTMAAAPTFGQLVELRAVLNANGSVQLHQSIDGAAEVSASASSAPSGGLAAAWAGERLYLGCDPAGTRGGLNPFTHVRFGPGSKTLAEMRALAGVS